VKALLEAEHRFKALTGAGFTAATRTTSGDPVVTRKFDPNVEETLFFFRGSSAVNSGSSCNASYAHERSMRTRIPDEQNAGQKVLNDAAGTSTHCTPKGQDP